MALPWKTRNDLLNRVLEKLGVLPAGQTANQEDTDAISLNTIVAMLGQLEIVYIGNIDQIPDAWFEPLADCIAFHSMTSFGISGEDATRLTNAYTMAVDIFRTMLRGRPTYEVMKTVGF